MTCSPWYYRIFDICIGSSFPLHGLEPCEGKEAEWQVEFTADGFEEDRYEWLHSWRAEDQKVLLDYARVGSAYVLRFPSLAGFLIDFKQMQVWCYPLGSSGQNTVAHLLADQVIPRILSHLGRVTMHASAVQSPDGRIAAFLGPSGQGKSTLAAFFHREGWPLLSDDCLLFEEKQGRVVGIPAYPSLRLWADSQEELYTKDDLGLHEFKPMAEYSDKKQVILGTKFTCADFAPKEIAALFLLNTIGEESDAGDIFISPAPGAEAIISMMKSLFALDVISSGAAENNFELIGKIAQSNLPINQLIFPREYKSLPYVLQAVKHYFGGSRPY